MPNPFATRYIRPGAIPYFFADPARCGEWLDRFRAEGAQAQLVGPHGVGKTSLGLELARHLRPEFPDFRHLTLRQEKGRSELIQVVGVQQHSFVADRGTQSLFHSEGVEGKSRTLFLIDGWQRFSRLNRHLFIENCRRLGHGVLVTSHRVTSRLPVLVKIESDRKIFFHLVRYLQRDSFFELDGAVVADAYEAAEGNFREAFMTLYDAFEAEKRQKLQDSSVRF